MSCLFWNVGYKYDELLCFGLFGNDHELCLFWALGHEQHDELTALFWAFGNGCELCLFWAFGHEHDMTCCFGLLAMTRIWLFWALGNDHELIVWGFLGSWQLAMSSLFWTFGKLSTLGIKSVVCWFPV
jgi:hypothetical protein